MAKTVLITGASSGIGKATVYHFQKKGWNVAATMRTPDNNHDFENLPNVFITQLDVTLTESVAAAIQKTITHFGKIDVVINNAGYGVIGPFENASEEQIHKQFDTNVFGMQRVIKVLLPHFRLNQGGCIVNISSVAGKIGLPIYSLYNATKFAVEGFSESLYYELKHQNIKIKLVLPGPVKTEFNNSSKDDLTQHPTDIYSLLSEKANRYYDSNFEKGDTPETIAKTIFKAATSSSNKLRYPAGNASKSYLFLKAITPDCIIRFITHKLFSL